MDKSEIINRIIAETGSESYLEIGYGNGHNFDKIECEIKIAVEPNFKKNSGAVYPRNSDEFFSDNERNHDVVFIDGLHHADQVRKDIINSMKCNARAIILHDTIPPTKEHQIVPRKQTSWTGDVWRAAVGLKEAYPDMRIETYRADYGLTVVYPDGKKVRKHFENMEMTYEEFNENKVELLNIID